MSVFKGILFLSTLPDFDPETGEIIETPRANLAEQSVSELSQALKRTLEDRFGHVRVRGEISGFRGAHTSGHVYFALKDENAKIEAIIWRGAFTKLRSKMQEGLEVIATGKISSYPNKSSYQIIIENIELAGAGALMALLEQRRMIFAAEGLFDADRKKPLPYLPQVIGVITSPTGAVIRDILHRLNDRFPRHVIVWPVRVQGETAAAEVAAAINGFNEMVQKPDLLIVARGGGSLEDLMPFNEEIVVRAVAASKIPLISAIGHETDTSLIDHAADWRAPTPTAAAEKAVPVRADLLVEVASLNARQKRGLLRALSEVRLRLQAASRALPKPDEILAMVRQRLDGAGAKLPRALKANLQTHALVLARQTGRLTLQPVQQRVSESRRRLGETQQRKTRALQHYFAITKDRLSSETKLMAALSYKSVLSRGFAVLRDQAGKPLRGVSHIKPEAVLQIEMADGQLVVQATKPNSQGSLF